MSGLSVGCGDSVGVVIAGLLVFAAVGCSGDEKAGATREAPTGAIELCGGEAISAEAGKALEVITGSSRFEASGEKSTVVHAAKLLSQDFTSSITGDGDICQVFAVDAAQSDRLEVTWELVWSPPEGEPAPKFSVLPMGERALAAPGEAVV
ncbi:hypothetical protein ACH4FV_11795 [Streptomyces anulatus]|uniref:hypothetical protein n=1 Tax=Streptomyces anulatus TaxID=1892 RepID=UPI0037B77641